MRLTLASTLAVVFLAVSWGASAAESVAEITTVQSFTLERALDPANVATTLPSLIPQPVLAEVASNTVVIRERFVYPAGSSGTVSYIQFSVPAGTPIPTPSTVDISGSTYFVAQLAVQKISVGSNTSYPSVQFSGVIASLEGPFGSMTGTPAALSFGYTNSAQPASNNSTQAFNNVLSSVGGLSSGYSAAGVGEMTLIQVPAFTNPCTGPIPITATVISTTANQIVLDGSQSFDCSGQPLTYYQWGVLNPLGSVTVTNPTSPKGSARLNAGPGEYNLTLTVTDAQGASATSNILVTYSKPQ
jgi:hypothetical protein